VISRKLEKQPCCSPFGKTDDTASPALPKVRRSLLQPHPWTPWIYSTLGFCNVRVSSATDPDKDWSSKFKAEGLKVKGAPRLEIEFLNPQDGTEKDKGGGNAYNEIASAQLRPLGYGTDTQLTF